MTPEGGTANFKRETANDNNVYHEAHEEHEGRQKGKAF
jgi:hypothetical protein